MELGEFNTSVTMFSRLIDQGLASRELTPQAPLVLWGPERLDGKGFTPRILSVAPLVMELPNFIGHRQAAALRSFFEANLARPRAVCFKSQALPLLEELFVAGTVKQRDLAQTEVGSLDDEKQVCVRGSKASLLKPVLKWSTSIFVLPGQSPIVDTVLRRLDADMGLPMEHLLRFQLLRYGAGEEYSAHTDCSLKLVANNDRAITVLIYLNSVDGGNGATEFPLLDVAVHPETGKALIFKNLDRATGFCDPRTRHTSRMMTEGVDLKYVAQLWYYAKPIKDESRDGYTKEGRKFSNQVVVCDNGKGTCRYYLNFDD